MLDKLYFIDEETEQDQELSFLIYFRRRDRPAQQIEKAFSETEALLNFILKNPDAENASIKAGPLEENRAATIQYLVNRST